MSKQRDDGAYVRLAHTSELSQLSLTLTRAFARDPAMNWYGGVKEHVPSPDSTLPSAVDTMRRLRYFQEFLVKGMMLVGGIITVVVRPIVTSTENGTATETRQEKIVAVALWYRAGQDWKMSPLQLVRAGIVKNLLFGWGLRGYHVCLSLDVIIESLTGLCSE